MELQRNAYGYSYFDDLQLEIGATPSSVNLLLDGDFETATTEWTRGSCPRSAVVDKLSREAKSSSRNTFWGTTASSIDGAICAQQSGGKWYDGAMAGAIGGSVGALVSSITNPTPGTDPALRMNTAGRVASSLLYDVSYDLFSADEIKASNVATYAIDVTMDATLSSINYFYTGNISNGYLRSSINGLVDGAIDVFQTTAYFTP